MCNIKVFSNKLYLIETKTLKKVLEILVYLLHFWKQTKHICQISPSITEVFLPNANIKCLSVVPNKLLSSRKNCQKDKETFFRKEKTLWVRAPNPESQF